MSHIYIVLCCVTVCVLREISGVLHLQIIEVFIHIMGEKNTDARERMGREKGGEYEEGGNRGIKKGGKEDARRRKRTQRREVFTQRMSGNNTDARE